MSNLSYELKNSIEKTEKEIDELTSKLHATSGIFLENEPTSVTGSLIQEICEGQLILHTQKHSWKHVKSCIKNSSLVSKGHCRYRFPRQPCLVADIDENGNYESVRYLGSEYINDYNDVLLQILKSNMDIRFLAVQVSRFVML